MFKFKRIAVIMVVFALLSLTVVPAFAQSVDEPPTPDVLDRVIQITQVFSAVIISVFVAFAGALVWLARVNTAPLASLIPRETVEKAFDFMEAIAKLTPTTSDDETLARLREEFMAELQDSVELAVQSALEKAAE